MSEQEGGISGLTPQQIQLRKKIYRKTGVRPTSTQVREEERRIQSRKSRFGPVLATAMSIDTLPVPIATGSIRKQSTRKSRLTEAQKLVLANAFETQPMEGTTRIRAKSTMYTPTPSSSNRKKHPDALTKKEIQTNFKRWSATKELKIKDILQRGIQYKIKTLKQTLEKITFTELNPIENDRLKYEAILIEKQAALDSLKTRSQKEASDYNTLNGEVLKLTNYFEKVLNPKLDAVNKRINRLNSLIQFYESLYKTVTADNMVDDDTLEKIVKVIEAESMDTSEDNTELDDLLSGLMRIKLGGGDCAGPISIPGLIGTRTEVVGAVAEEVASLPAPMEGGKKKRAGKKTQKGGEVVGAVAEEVASLPAPMEGGKKKRAGKKTQKGGEVVGAVAEEVASQSGPMEGGKKKRAGKKN